MVKHAGSLPHVEDDVEVLCTEQRAHASRENAARAWALFQRAWVYPLWVCRRHDPNRRSVRAARGTVVHLPRQGFLLRTWEPQSERRAREARQADKSGDVSDEGRSLHSSRSAGKPRTWR